MPIGWCLAQTRHGCDAYSLFTPKFGKKNVGTQSFQDCVIEESNMCESISADVMSESAILWMTSVHGVNGLYLNGARKMCWTLQIKKIRVQLIIKLGSFLLFQEL